MSNPSGARPALDFYQMVAILDRAEGQLDALGDDVEYAAAEELRARIARARQLLSLIGPAGRDEQEPKLHPFWLNFPKHGDPQRKP